MNIEQQDLIVFERNFPLYETIKKAGFVRNYTKETYFDLLKLYEKYISAKHTFAFHCGECRFYLVKQLFYFYENQLTEQSKQVVQVNQEEKIEENQEEDFIVAIFSPTKKPDQTPEQTPEKRKYKKRTPKN
jgi:hypothetical protein